MKVFTRWLCLMAVFVFTSGMIYSQNKNTVILINSVPYNVVITSEGEIAEIKGEAKNHMRGFIRSKDEFDLPPDRSIVIDSRADADAGLSVRARRTFVGFQPGTVAISEPNEEILNEALKSFSMDSDDKILITGFKGSEDEGNRIVESRITSVKTFLKAKGIPDRYIETEIVVSPSLVNQLSITYFR
ncbi:MAG TPA: hypothetical protein PKC30_05895 [Saprospiraceae bacterium]|nr:hypothetical protein [Saprospiraceae bacterium]